MPVTADRWIKRVDAIRAALPRAARAAAVQGALAFTRWMDENARKDTNRYVRGWQTAFNEVGKAEGVSVRVSQVVNSRKNDVYIAILLKEEAQARRELLFRTSKLEKRLGYTKGKVGAHERKEMARIRKLDKRITRLDEEIEKAQGATGLLFFDKYRGGRSFSTVRVKVYGGTGAVHEAADGTASVVMRDLEPHSRILESKYKFVAKAAIGARGEGLRRVAKAHAKVIARADPFFARVLSGELD